MIEKIIEQFKYGTVDTIEDKSIPRGAASRALNFVTKGDAFELRRGLLLMGTEILGSGKVTGIGIAEKADGTQILYMSYGKKVRYYDSSSEDWVEVSVDVLGSDADGDEVAFSAYHSLHGAQWFFTSANSGMFKIMTANPGSHTALYDATKNYKGLSKVGQNRMWLWQRKEDKTAPYLSYIDKLNSTTVSSEQPSGWTGDGSTKTFTGTLAFRAANPKNTCFGISVIDGTETFTDDYNGVLTGDLGGTGTIDYTTGAISVTFNTAPPNTQAITVDYQHENSNNQGITDFTYTTPTRVAGEGDVFRQDDGGQLQNILAYRNIEYCLHKRKAWELTLTADDTNATNLIYREKVGIPNHRAAVATGEGVYYVDDTDEKDPRVRILRYASGGSSEVVPVNISANRDLSDYRFDKAAMTEWGDYIVIACRHKNSTENNIVITYDREWKSLDTHDYWVSCMAVYNGTLVAGDSISNNVYTLFSGFDDDDANIDGYWESNLDNLDNEGLQKVKQLIVQGEIQPDQSFDVYTAIDRGQYVKVGTQNGDDSNVDTGQKVLVGSVTVGSKEVGGGGDGVVAYNYKKKIKLRLDKFERVKVKIVPTGIGYLSVSRLQYRDIRFKSQKISSKYR